MSRVALTLIAGGTVVHAALPVMRHSVGIVTIETTSTALPPAVEPQVRVDLAPLLERAPFGQAARSEPVASSTSAAAPDFVLRGVFSSIGATSAALLQVDGTTRLYREAEDVTADYALRRVATDHVILTGKGQTITLSFDAEDVLETEQQSDKTASGPADLIARLGRDLVVPARPGAAKPPETTSEYIDYWRKRVQKNPKAVLDEIGLTPSEDGYFIADQHDVGVRLAGLKSGDLVRSVNGQAVGNPDDDRRFYDRVAASGQARLEVERNGRILTFSFPLR
jgi:general secretion pathway protein C